MTRSTTHPTTTTTTRTITKAYYAHLDDEAGALAKVDGEIYFMADATKALTTIGPEHMNFLTVLGEIGLADMQHIRDHMKGGAAAIACTRANLEV